MYVEEIIYINHYSDGSGYVEDGRDIFDDDLDTESIAKATAKGKGVKRKKKDVSESAGKGNLHAMLSNMSSKKKEVTFYDFIYNIYFNVYSSI